MELKKLLESITPPADEARQEARRRWNACAKPIGGLGLLETILEDIAALTGSADIDLSRRCVVVTCASNGVLAQGVASAPPSMTTVIADALAAGQTSVGRMAQVAHCDVVPVDLGITDYPETPGMLRRRIGNGTGDIFTGPAMSRQQAEQAICTGIQLVQELKEQGYTLIATGELGIGNTTTSAAVAAVLLGRPVEEMTGRGAGLSDEGLAHKIQVIRHALEINRPDPADSLDIIAKVGGFDIGCMCGLYLGGAIYSLPILVDGVISAAAALCAQRLCPAADKAIFATHCSAEPAGRLLLEAMGKAPLITAGMRLGEGTGAVAAIPMLDMAAAVYGQSATFDDCGVETYLKVDEIP